MPGNLFYNHSPLHIQSRPRLAGFLWAMVGCAQRSTRNGGIRVRAFAISRLMVTIRRNEFGGIRGAAGEREPYLRYAHHQNEKVPISSKGPDFQAAKANVPDLTAGKNAFSHGISTLLLSGKDLP